MFYLGTIVKNYEKWFDQFENFIDSMIQQLPLLCVCIYEDNSTDRTPELLEQLKLRYPENLYIWSESFDWDSKSIVKTCDGKPCRIECIAYARNQLMSLLESKDMGNREDDVCIMIDTDFKISPNTQEIAHWVTHFPNDVDALFANGKDCNKQYYDIFAYRDTRFPFDYDIYGEKNHTALLDMKTQICKQFLSNEKTRVPVISAFGGIGIYRGTAIKGNRYSFLPTKELDTFYQTIIKNSPENFYVKMIKELQLSPETHYHGSLLGRKMFNYFYYNCYGYNVPIVCEHVNFHIKMHQNGHDRLFIEPSLSYTWSH